MKYFYITFIVIAILFSSCAQITRESDTTQRIENYLTAIENVGFNGSVFVDLDGDPIISKGYGYSNFEDQIRNTPTTIFDTGSLTKQFTAAAILTLEMQGKLSTDDSITKYFEDVPADKEMITIHDLLRHQSGLISGVGRDYEKISEDDFLDKVFSSELRFEVGTGFNYSNMGYSLLAMIIEKVSNQEYEAYLYENLWKPSGMEMTGYTRPNYDMNRMAVGYYRNDSIWGKPTDKEWDDIAPYWHLKGNGGILSTTDDLHKWHKVLLTENVLSEGAKQKMYAPSLRPDETIDSYYGYGWDVSKTPRNTTQLWHNGANGYFYADYIRLIDENSTFIMMTNQSNRNFNDLILDIMRIVNYPDYQPEIPAADNDENRRFTTRIINTIKEYGLDKAKSEYLDRIESEHLLEYEMRNEGFNLIENDKSDIAIQIFEMNVYAYPESARALQGLGEGFMETGNKELALKYFKESLRLRPEHRFVSDMIKELEG